jgi:hypothetical protein
MRGKVATAVEEVEFDGATATLTMEREIRDGFDYTIGFGELEAVVAGQDSEVAAINFPYDYANILAYDTAETLVVYYDIVDQFGNDVTEDNDNMTTFYTIGGGLRGDNGELLIGDKDTNWLIGMPVVVNAVYNDEAGVVVTTVKTFEIAGPIKLAELALGAPMNLGEETADIMKDQPFGDDDEDDFYWVLPVTALNQYGDQVPASYFDDDNFTASGVTAEDVTNGNDVVVDEDGALYVALDGYTDEDNENTTAFVTVIDLNSGLNDSVTFVIPKAGVSEFKAIGPADEVIGGETVEIEFEAYDYYGNEVTDVDDMGDVKVGTLVIADDEDWKFATDPFTDVVTLEYKAEDNDTAYAKPVFFTFTVENTASVSQLNFSISENRRPIDIQGFDDTDLLYAETAEGEITVEDLIFIDQYGEDMDYEAVTDLDGYSVQFGTATTAVTSFEVDTAEDGDTDYTAYLLEAGDIDDPTAEFEFTVEVIDVDDIDEYVLSEIPAMYADEDLTTTATVATKYTVELEVTGEYNGKAVVLPTPELVVETYPSTNLGETVEGSSILAAFGIADDEDDDTTAVVLVSYTVSGSDDDEARGIFERTIDLSGVAPEAEKLEVALNDDADDATISGNSVETLDTNLVSGMSIVADDDQDEPALFYFEATDQYGVVTEDVYSYFYLVETEVDTYGTYKVNTDGELLIPGTMVDGDTFKVTAVTASGLTQTIEVKVVK